MEPGKTFSVQCPGDGDGAFASGRAAGVAATQATCDETVKEATGKVSMQKRFDVTPLFQRQRCGAPTLTATIYPPTHIVLCLQRSFARLTCVHVGSRSNGSTCRSKRRRRCSNLFRGRKGKSNRNKGCQSRGTEGSACRKVCRTQHLQGQRSQLRRRNAKYVHTSVG